MDLWLLETKYEALISEVYGKQKKGDGVWKKILINNIVRRLKEEVKIIKNFKPIVTVRPQLRRK